METSKIRLAMAKDGSLSWLNTSNVYQFSDDVTEVELYSPYSPGNATLEGDTLVFTDTLAVWMSVQLPGGDDTEDERPMLYTGAWEVEGAQYYVWTASLDSYITAIAGDDYAAEIELAFRFCTPATGQDLTTGKMRIPVQPSLQGGQDVVDIATADSLLGTMSSVQKNVLEALSIAKRADSAASQAVNISRGAKATAEHAETVALGIAGTAQEAKDAALIALTKSEHAETVALGIAGTANQALTNSQEAVRLSNVAVEIANSKTKWATVQNEESLADLSVGDYAFKIIS